MNDLKKLKNKKIAHRGIFNNKSIIENTLNAFKKATSLNYPIEFDIQLTKDNQIVVFHDEALERLTNSKKLVKDLSLNEIKNLKLLNSTNNIPTLKEVLTLINGKVPIIIEIKNTRKKKLICNLLQKELKNYNGEFYIQSFNPQIIRIYKSKNDHFCGLLINKKFNNINNILLIKIILKYFKIDFLSVSKKIINSKKIKILKNDYLILVWTINSKEELNKYLKSSDIYICNNLPF